jgi:curli biogenesis system outer membrane secretion channel CsgG
MRKNRFSDRGIFVALFFLTLLIIKPVVLPAQTTPPEALSSNDRQVSIAVIAHSDFLPDRTAYHDKTVTGLPDLLADRIIEHLANSRRFVPVERAALRKVIMEQRFGKELQQTYLDRTLDKAIENLDSVEGGAVIGTIDGGGLQSVTPQPVGKGIGAGTGDVGTTGTLSDYNDILKDFQDLGSASNADYLVYGNLEKLDSKSTEIDIPYSTAGTTFKQAITDARIRLRIIEVQSGRIAGATSLKTQVRESLFEGMESDTDEFSFYDHLGRLASVKILDIVFPAHIVDTEPLVLSRGSNDGVQNGDVFAVERLGKSFSEASGAEIGRLKTRIGTVQVLDAQENISVAEPVSGSGFLKGDLVAFDVSAKQSQAAPGRTSPAVTPPPAQEQQKGGLPRLAIGLIKSGSTETSVQGEEKHIEIFTDSLISRLTQTRRFILIDRQEVDLLLKEQLAGMLAENREMPSAMGTLKGADYLLLGSVSHFGVQDKQTSLPGSSRVFEEKIGTVEANIRIVAAASGDILESRKIAIEEPVAADAKGTMIATRLADVFAEQATLILMNVIYPIKVASVGSDGIVYVNRGNDGGLSIQERLDAYRPGKPVIDPDTGIQLGVEESLIGQVVLFEVEDTRSKGNPSEGAIVQTGDILKRTLENRLSRSGQAAAGKKEEAVRSGAVMGEKTASSASGPGETATLAVGMIRMLPVAGTDSFKEDYTEVLTDKFIARLSQNKRLQVLERQQVDQILDEKTFTAITEGGDVLDKLSDLRGADYLIHGLVSQLVISTVDEKVPYMDRMERKVSGTAEGIFRIVDVHTGSVIAAEDILVRQKLSGTDASTSNINQLTDTFADRIVHAVTERLFPIKILGVAEDGTAYINRGLDGGIRAGTMYTVMRQGKAMIDPDTGISFGAAETKVATVKVEAIENNRSRAVIVSGGEVLPGDILREPVIEKKEPPPMNKPKW